MIGFYAFFFIMILIISALYVKSIDFMNDNHPDYKGEDFLGEDFE